MSDEESFEPHPDFGWEVPEFQPFNAALRGADLDPGCLITRQLLNTLAGLSETGVSPADALASTIPALVTAIYRLERRLIAGDRNE